MGLVTVSTTLSTNTLLEETGDPVGLILVGEHAIEKEFPAKNFIFVSGGHDHNGEEIAPLDILGGEYPAKFKVEMPVVMLVDLLRHILMN